MPAPKKLGIAGCIIFFMGIMFGWVVFPIVQKSQVHGQTALSKNGEMRPRWSQLPFPWTFKVYLFNITNPVEIQNGEKPIVKEIGPYFYDEWKEKIDLVDNEKDDTVEFSPRTTYLFNPAKSNGLTGDEELTFPHLAMLTSIMLTAGENPSKLGILAKAIDSIYKKPNSIFIKAKAREIIFDGLPIDCTVKDFAGSAVCSIIKTRAQNLVVVGEDMYKFSLFGHNNATVGRARTKVIRGIKIPKDLGRVVQWNNQSALTVWPEDHCNAFNGTDGTIFRAFFPKHDDVVSFAPDICRSLSLRYDHPSKAYGFRVNHYVADLGDQSSIPEEKCYCPTPETCLKKGAMDLTKCMGKPIVATLPHFYMADPSYLDSVSGLHPNKDDHEFWVELEPMTGTPLQFSIALQFNMFIYSVDKIKFMKNFPDALLPLFWFDEGIEMSDDIISEFKSAFRLIAAVTALKWTMLVLGLGLGSAAVALEYKQRMMNAKHEVTPVLPITAGNDTSKNNAGDVQKWQTNISTLQPATVPPSVDRN